MSMACRFFQKLCITALIVSGLVIPISAQDDLLNSSTPHESTQQSATSDASSSIVLAIVLQALSSLGSFGALFFLIWQLRLLQRQTQDLEHSIKSATYQQIASSYIEINKLMIERPEVAKVFDRMLSDDLPVDDTEKHIRVWLVTWLINHYENAFIQNSICALPDAGWKGIEQDCLVQLRKPGVVKVWREISHLFSEEFRIYLISHGIESTLCNS